MCGSHLELVSYQQASTVASQVVLVVKKSTCLCRILKRPKFDTWIRKIP